jgi:AraC-like DNA-binding protein
MPQAVSFSTAGLPTAQRIALWEDHNAHALIGLRCSMLGESELDATELNLQLEHMHLARVRGNAHVVERPAPLIRRHPSDSIAVYLTLVGEAFFYHSDGLLTLRPGQALICDADRPFMRGFSGGLEELAIKIPRPLFRDLTGRPDLPTPLVRDFTGGDPATRALARLTDRALRLRGPEPIHEDTALDLLVTVLGGHPRAETPVHLVNAYTYIDDHLTDPNLSVPRVAAAIGISERHLSRAFAQSGPTFPQYVLGRRLDRAHALLTRSPQIPIAEVAVRCGFTTPSRFSQAFHTRFGLRPTDVRRQARAEISAELRKP